MKPMANTTRVIISALALSAMLAAAGCRSTQTPAAADRSLIQVEFEDNVDRVQEGDRVLLLGLPIGQARKPFILEGTKQPGPDSFGSRCSSAVAMSLNVPLIILDPLFHARSVGLGAGWKNPGQGGALRGDLVQIPRTRISSGATKCG